MSMAAYLTTAGLTVLNKVIASRGSLKFVRAELGSGVCTTEAACRARTSLVNRMAYATLVSARYEGGEAKISCQYKNEGLAQGFFVNEIGLYVQDPDSSSQVLYCYATFGDGSTPDWIAAASSAIYTRTYDIITIISDAANVTVQTSPSALVTAADFEVYAKGFETAMMAVISENSMINRDIKDRMDTIESTEESDRSTLDTRITNEKAALQKEMRTLDDAQASHDNQTMIAIITAYDAIARDLNDRLTVAENKLAALST